MTEKVSPADNELAAAFDEVVAVVGGRIHKPSLHITRAPSPAADAERAVDPQLNAFRQYALVKAPDRFLVAARGRWRSGLNDWVGVDGDANDMVPRDILGGDYTYPRMSLVFRIETTAADGRRLISQFVYDRTEADGAVRFELVAPPGCTSALYLMAWDAEDGYADNAADPRDRVRCASNSSGSLPGRSGTIEGDVTVQVLGKDEFDILLRGAQSRTASEIKTWLEARNDEDFWGHCIPTEARDLKYAFIGNGIEFFFYFRVEDMLDNLPPLGECDCDVYIKLRILWRLAGDGGYQLLLDEIHQSDLSASCPACPMHTLGIAWYQFLNAFKPISERRELKAGMAVIQQSFALATAEASVVASQQLPANARPAGSVEVRILNIWVDGGRLMASMHYRLTYDVL